MAFPLLPVIMGGAGILGSLLGKKKATTNPYTMEQISPGTSSYLSQALGWAKNNPYAVLAGLQILGSMSGGRSQRKMMGAQQKMLEQQLLENEKKSKYREAARRALARYLEMGPFGNKVPDVSDIFQSLGD